VSSQNQKKLKKQKLRRLRRVRGNQASRGEKLRVSVFRSLNHISAQVIDDSRLAQRYIDYRLNASPRSGKMLKYELLKKGINAETIAENIGNL
jgi:ribosomal protein L18